MTVPAVDAPEAVVDAERAALGCALISRDAAETIADRLTPADFHTPAHQAIHAAIAALGDAGAPVDIATVSAELTRTGQITAAGGPAYLARIADVPGTPRSAGHYADLVKGDARRRLMMHALNRSQLLAQRPDYDADTCETIRAAVDRAAAQDSAAPSQWIADLLPDFVDRLDQPHDPSEFIAPPYRQLTDIVPGFRAGQLITVGARPSIGKSVMAADIARHTTLRQGHPTYLASLEMSADELQARLLAAESRVDLSALQRDPHRRPTEEEWTRIADRYSRVAAAPLTIDTDTPCTLAHIRARLRAMARQQRPARIAIVDYLQLMQMGRAESRERAVADTARALKQLAQEFAIPVVVLAQLNRSVESRGDKTPQLSDLRESGSVEQDSDIVLLLHRPDFYDPDTTRAGEMDVIVAKNRGGRRGTATVAFQGRYARAVDFP